MPLADAMRSQRGWARGRYGPTQRPAIEAIVHVDRFGNQPWRSVEAHEIGGGRPQPVAEQ